MNAKPLQSRFLRVLIIDDQLDPVFLNDTFGKYLDLVSVRTWTSAQKRIAEFSNIEVDVILVDLSFEKDNSLKAAHGAAESGVFPVGPMLALPFIGSRAVMSCVMYSAHFRNAILDRHPFFLICLGLISSRTEGIPDGKPFRSRWLEGGTKDASLDVQLDRLRKRSKTEPTTALIEGLDEYRDRLYNLIKDGEVITGNRESLCATLTMTGDSVEGIPPLVVVGKGWSDRIDLRSLFAHTELGWLKEEPTAEWLELVRDWVVKLPCGAHEAAIEVMKHLEASDAAACLGRSRGEDRTPREVREVIRELYGKRQKEELTEILRYAVLFANAKANIEAGSFTREAVFQNLGGKVEHQIYRGWFGTRSAGGKPRGAFGWIRPLSENGEGDERLFLSKTSIISDADMLAVKAFLSSCGNDDDEAIPYQTP